MEKLSNENNDINVLFDIFLSKFFKKIRLEHGLTQKKIAELLDKSEITIRNYENNRLKVPFEVLFFLITIFKLSPHPFFVSFEKTRKNDVSISDNDYALIMEKLQKLLTKLYRLKPFKFENDRETALNLEKQLLTRELELYSNTFLTRNYSLQEILLLKDSEVNQAIKNTIEYLEFSLTNRMKLK